MHLLVDIDFCICGLDVRAFALLHLRLRGGRGLVVSDRLIWIEYLAIWSVFYGFVNLCFIPCYVVFGLSCCTC